MSFAEGRYVFLDTLEEIENEVYDFYLSNDQTLTRKDCLERILGIVKKALETEV